MTAKLKTYPLGILFPLVLAILCTIVASYIPYGIISSNVLALLIGIALSPLINKTNLVSGGLNLTAKTFLKVAIILMGLSLSYNQILMVGGYSLIVMVFTLISAFGFGWLFGKLFKLDWKLSSLISAGTGICGGSAIAAIAPTIGAKDSDIAISISATFLFDILMVILFPILGKAMGMSDMGFGLWAGTAVNDTSSVVTAGMAFSEAAGEYATIVKLTRTLSIIPIVLIFSGINIYLEKKKHKQVTLAAQADGTIDTLIGKIETPKASHYFKIFPWFILGFIILVTVNSFVTVPTAVHTHTSNISHFLMTMALAAIGMKTNLKTITKVGYKPMLHGFIISLLVVLISLLVQVLLKQF